MFFATRDTALSVTLASVIDHIVGVTGNARPVAVIRLNRWVPIVGGLHFASDVQPAIGTRISHLEAWSRDNTFSPSQEPDMTRILPSG